MYYFYTDRFDERWETTWPAWRQIGVNLPFADPLLKIVAEYREAIVGDWTSQVSRCQLARLLFGD